MTTYVWACRARLLSSGSGSTALPRRSLSISTRSMPEAPPWELSESPLALPAQLHDVKDGTAEVFTLEPGCGGEMMGRVYGSCCVGGE